MSCITCLMPKLVQFVFQNTWQSTGEVRIPPDPSQYKDGLPLPPQCSQWVLVPFQTRKIFQIALGQTLRTSKTGGSDNQTVVQEEETPHTDPHNSHRGSLGGVAKCEEQEEGSSLALQGSWSAWWGGQRRKVREAGVSSARIPSTARQISKQPESFQPCSGLGTPYLTAKMVVGFRTWLTLRSSVHLPWSFSWSSTTSGHGCMKTTFFFFSISKTLQWYLSLCLLSTCIPPWMPERGGRFALDLQRDHACCSQDTLWPDSQYGSW